MTNLTEIGRRSDDAFEAKVERIIDHVDANELQAASIKRLAALIRHGGTIDILVRRDGKAYQFEGDWLAWLFRPRPPV